MKWVVCDGVVLPRPLDGPLSTHIPEYAKWARDAGYALYSLRRRIRLAACFSRWLGSKNEGTDQIRYEHAARYLRSRRLRVKVYTEDSAAIRQFIDFLRSRGVVPAEETRPPSAIDLAVDEYEVYLCSERALSQATIKNYLPFVRDFLDYRFGNKPLRLSQLRAGDVVGFVQREARRLHGKRAKLMTTALRSFLRYARYRGDVCDDLAAAVPTVANWSMPSIPRAISPALVQQLLSSISQGTAIGRRDYAIILLLARLGLRAGEIAGIDLEDIDWNAGLLHLRRKGGERAILPLPTEVGTAIAAYLRHGRPRGNKCRRVFLRSRAPLRGFQDGVAVASLVQHHLQRAGITAPTQGAHQFRHGLATDMLRHGASLDEIGEVLGHRSPETTKIYTKVDLDALRPLALPWPGGVR